MSPELPFTPQNVEKRAVAAAKDCFCFLGRRMVREARSYRFPIWGQGRYALSTCITLPAHSTFVAWSALPSHLQCSLRARWDFFCCSLRARWDFFCPFPGSLGGAFFYLSNTIVQWIVMWLYKFPGRSPFFFNIFIFTF